MNGALGRHSKDTSQWTPVGLYAQRACSLKRSTGSISYTAWIRKYAQSYEIIITLNDLDDLEYVFMTIRGQIENLI